MNPMETLPVLLSPPPVRAGTVPLCVRKEA